MLLLSSALTVLVALLTLYRFAIIAYRLFFHPLRHIPGPKIASITTLYESYYDLVKGGVFTFKVRDLHREYG